MYTSTYNVMFGGQVIENGDESLPYLPDHKVAIAVSVRVCGCVCGRVHVCVGVVWVGGVSVGMYMCVGCVCAGVVWVCACVGGVGVGVCMCMGCVCVCVWCVYNYVHSTGGLSLYQPAVHRCTQHVDHYSCTKCIAEQEVMKCNGTPVKGMCDVYRLCLASYPHWL